MTPHPARAHGFFKLSYKISATFANTFVFSDNSRIRNPVTKQIACLYFVSFLYRRSKARTYVVLFVVDRNILATCGSVFNTLNCAVQSRMRRSAFHVLRRLNQLVDVLKTTDSFLLTSNAAGVLRRKLTLTNGLTKCLSGLQANLLSTSRQSTCLADAYVPSIDSTFRRSANQWRPY